MELPTITYRFTCTSVIDGEELTNSYRFTFHTQDGVDSYIRDLDEQVEDDNDILVSYTAERL